MAIPILRSQHLQSVAVAVAAAAAVGVVVVVVVVVVVFPNPYLTLLGCRSSITKQRDV